MSEIDSVHKIKEIELFSVNLYFIVFKINGSLQTIFFF